MAPRAAQCAIAIMAKESTPGRVKTRLVPPLTTAQAAEINTCFLRDIAANIAAAGAAVPIQGYAAYHPPGSEAFFRDVLPEGFGLFWPGEAGIGRALPLSAAGLLEEGFGAMCLVNADSPNLPTEYLVEAVRVLNRPGDRMVLGPSDDGGYYLIGLKQFHARLFEDIEWSTGWVAGQTLERAAEIGLEVAMLPAWYDVDDAAMLTRLDADVLGPRRRGSAAPATSAWLRARHAAADPRPAVAAGGS